MKSDNSSVKECSFFDFMSNVVGMTVLHPGGYEATKQLCQMCNINENSHILDVACGKGTSSCFFVEKFGCRVTGVDVSEKLVNMAKELVKKKGLEDKIEFKIADAAALPFEDNSFDAVIIQALMVMVDDKIQKKILEESLRVLKPGGYFGSIELSWSKQPGEETIADIAEKMCDVYMRRVKTSADWEKTFKSAGFKHISTEERKMNMNMSYMFKTEGVKNTMKIMGKIMSNSAVRKQMMDVWKVFSRYSDLIGHGIFSFKKWDVE